MSSSADRPTVFIIEDDALERSRMSLALRTAGLDVRGFASADAFLQVHTPEASGCLLLDVQHPGMGGVGLINALHLRGNRLPVVACSGVGQTTVVVEAMRAGAVDVLEKPLNMTNLVSAVRSAMRVGGAVAELRSEAAAAAHHLRELSPRELEIFGRFSHGTSTKQIADAMSLSPKTVETYRTRLLGKFGLDTPAALIRLSVLIAVFGPMMDVLTGGGQPTPNAAAVARSRSSY